MDINNTSLLIFEPNHSKYLIITYSDEYIDENESIILTNKLHKFINSNTENIDSKHNSVSNAIITSEHIIIVHSVGSADIANLKLSSFKDLLQEIIGDKSIECNIIKFSEDNIQLQKKCLINKRCISDIKKLICTKCPKEILSVIT